MNKTSPPMPVTARPVATPGTAVALRRLEEELLAAEVRADVVGTDRDRRDDVAAGFFFEAAERTASGVADGLAVTGVGSNVLFIEATREDGSEEDGLTLSMMKESVQIALSYVGDAHASDLGASIP